MHTWERRKAISQQLLNFYPPSSPPCPKRPGEEFLAKQALTKACLDAINIETSANLKPPPSRATNSPAQVFGSLLHWLGLCLAHNRSAAHQGPWPVSLHLQSSAERAPAPLRRVGNSGFDPWNPRTGLSCCAKRFHIAQPKRVCSPTCHCLLHLHGRTGWRTGPSDLFQARVGLYVQMLTSPEGDLSCFETF